jgi:hypothetical protein
MLRALLILTCVKCIFGQLNCGIREQTRKK